jgi:hypothetical protein
MSERVSHVLAAAGAAVLLASAGPQVAMAQQFTDPVDIGGQRNGAAIAQMIERVEERDETSGVAGSGGSTTVESTTVLCGGGGRDGTSSSATSNRNCIILNDANGEVQVGQDSAGDQTADADQATGGGRANTNANGKLSDAIEKLAQ